MIQSFKWQLSKRLKNLMRERDIDTVMLVEFVAKLYEKAHPKHDENIQVEIFTILDEYNPNLDIEIFDMVCKVLGAKICFGDEIYV